MTGEMVIEFDEYIGTLKKYRARLKKHLNAERKAVLSGNFEAASKAREAFFAECGSKPDCNCKSLDTATWRTAYREQSDRQDFGSNC